MTKNKEIYILAFFIGIFCTAHFLFHITKHQFIHWDEAVYIGMGKYIFSNGSIGLWEAIRPPLLPILTGLLWKLNWAFYYIIGLVFGIGTLLLIYYITKRIINKETAIVATTIYLITPIFIKNSFLILTEIPTMFFILLTVYLLIEKKHPVFIGITTGITFLTKFPAGLLLLAIFLIYAMKTKKWIKPIMYTTVGFIATTLPFFIINYMMYRPYTSNIIDAIFRPLLFANNHANNIVHAIQNPIENLLYYPIEIMANNPIFIFAITGIVIVLWNKEMRQKAHYYLIPLFLFITYFTFITNKQLRFALLFLPWIVMLTAIGITKTVEIIHKWIGIKKTILIVMFVFATMYTVYPQYVEAYRYFPSEQPEIETYYTFFADKSGTILTTEPYFVAYTDTILAIPYYENANEAQALYNEYKDDVDYIVFNSDFYPCQNKECEEVINEIEGDIVANNVVVYEEEWSGSTKMIAIT
jgi:4-amino-4-deoxy-L-arabinose transferase-like glycosyltransferase